eukprot:1161215-Pelagomonas_calceolata.AAC.8
MHLVPATYGCACFWRLVPYAIGPGRISSNTHLAFGPGGIWPPARLWQFGLNVFGPICNGHLVPDTLVPGALGPRHIGP